MDGGAARVAILEEVHFPDVDPERDRLADFSAQKLAGPECPGGGNEVFINDDDLKFPVAGLHAGDVAALFDQVVHWDDEFLEWMVGREFRRPRASTSRAELSFPEGRRSMGCWP